MSSQRRISASRANGALSHGPVTPEGKLRSAANSVRHGLLARTVVLEGEDQQAFTDLLTALDEGLQPQSHVEQTLVDRLAIAQWRTMRLWAIESASLGLEMSTQDPSVAAPATRAALAFRSLCDNSRTLDLLNRYEARFDRQSSRTLDLLLKLQTHPSPHRPQ